ncbi:MAG: cell division protein FtsA [Synergistaceae bacterium]|nr:cell division protein FtsA [Synergistaceae bacterium]
MFGNSFASGYADEPEIIAALDLGTSKISVIVAEKETESEEPHIITVEECPSSGIRKGSIINAELASRAIKQVLNSAEATVGQPLKTVSVSFSCSEGMQCVATQGKFLLGVNARPVSEDDIERVVQIAKDDLAVPSNKTVVHTIPVRFILDDKEIENPLDMTGKTLQIELLNVMVPSSAIQDTVNCIKRAGVEIDSIVLKPLSASLSVITEEEARNGAAVLDIGGGTTDLTVYSNGHPVYMVTIPIGGDHVSNDLASVLKIPLVCAEDIKRRVCLGIEYQNEEDENEYVEFSFNNRLSRVLRRETAEIISCRIEELCRELIMPKINEAGVKSLDGGIILTGGIAEMRGIDSLMRDIFELSVRKAVPSVASQMPGGRNGGEFSGAAGIIKYVTEKQRAPYRFMDGYSDVGSVKKDSRKLQPSAIKNIWTEKNETIKKELKTETKNIGSKIKGLFSDLF